MSRSEVSGRWRIVRTFGCLSLSLMANGCLFFGAQPVSFERQAQQLQTQIDSLQVRADHLERAGTLGSSAGSSGAAAAASDVGAGGFETAAFAEPGTFARSGGTWTVNDSTARGGDGRWPGMSINLKGAATKLWRGFVNVTTGWVELPKRIHETTQISGAGAGATYGLLRGLGHGFVRTLGGAYEVITFPFPAPPGYRPIIQPPYVFVCES